MQSQSGCVGIGRQPRLRIWCRKAYGFESLHPHKETVSFETVSFFMYMSDHLMAQVDGAMAQVDGAMAQVDGAMAQVPKKGGDLRHRKSPNA